MAELVHVLSCGAGFRPSLSTKSTFLENTKYSLINSEAFLLLTGEKYGLVLIMVQ